MTTTIKAPKPVYSVAEYLEIEDNSQEKHEYRNGEIIVMTGATTNHNKLALAMASKLLTTLEDQDYEIYMGDVRLWIESKQIYAYPDVMTVQGKPIYQGQAKTTIVNPIVIIEILSKSTQDYDQNEKFDAYRTLESLQEYILIDQYQYSVQQFAKNQANQWVIRDYQGAETILKLETIDFQISLKDLYKKVVWD